MKTWLQKTISIMTVIAFLFSGMLIAPNYSQTVSAKETEEEIEWIEITNISELYAIRNNLEGNYILMNDIDMTEDTAPGGAYDTGNGWVPIDDFSGTFDGNGHRIIGMQIFGEISSPAGLFGTVYGGIIKNLGMKDVNINIAGTSSCGAIVGKISQDARGNPSVISNCFVTGTLYFTSSTYIGGLAGYSTWGTEYYDCYNVSNVTSSEAEYCGGILGGVDHWYGGERSYINRCYNVGSINAGKGMALGESNSEDINTFLLQGTGQGDIPLTETQMKNKNFFTGFDFDNTWYIDPYCNYKYPQLKSCPQIQVDSLEVITPPSKTVYAQGEELDISGATVKIIYEDKLEQEILLTKDMLGDYDMSKVGTQKIPVKWMNASTSFDISVKEIPVSSVQLNKSELTINKGKTETLTASVLPSDATDKSFTWSVVSGDSVSIDQNGKITANKKGTAVVRATAANGEYAECVVTVTVPCVMLQLNNNEITMNKGDVLPVAETIGYQMSPVDSTDTVTWTSSNDKVLQIDSEGNMTGLAAGMVTITATSTSGTTAICSVTVQREIGEFTILGVTNKYYTGKEIKQKFTVSDGTKTLKENVDYKVTYQSNVDVGTAKMTIMGIKPYTGSIVKEFQILQLQEEDGNTESNTTTTIKKPSKVVIKKVTPGKKKLTVTWKKTEDARGYKVQIARNRKFTKSLKTYKVSSQTTKKVITKLKKRKNYYIRVMAWCNDENGVILNGTYSTTKKKKTK